MAETLESGPTPRTSRSQTSHSNLVAAKAAKNDEFYTQWADIEREMNAYLEYDPDVFRDKVVLLPCDDPEWSNFSKFFALHFMDFGLKKLILAWLTVIHWSSRIPPVSPELGFHDQ